jgi:uncharacterized protein YdhG (YjbR/CyaY superfamily)
LHGSVVAKPRKAFKTIDEYIATFPENVQNALQQLRQVIKDTAPETEEAISYQIPAFKMNGNLVWFAAFKNHIGSIPLHQLSKHSKMIYVNMK